MGYLQSIHGHTVIVIYTAKRFVKRRIETAIYQPIAPNSAHLFHTYTHTRKKNNNDDNGSDHDDDDDDTFRFCLFDSFSFFFFFR